MAERRAIRQAMLRSGLTRAALFPVTAIAALVGARLMVDDLGVDGFGIVTLVAGLTTLLPFSDLGLGAPIIAAVARDESGLRRTLAVAWSALFLAGGALAVAAATIWLTVGWSTILGADVSSAGVNGLLICFCMAIPLGIGQRMLTGLGKVSTVVMLQTLQSIITLGVVLTAHSSQRPVLYYVAPGVGAAAAALVSFLVARRAIPASKRWPLAEPALAGAGRLLSEGVPMMVISICLALTLQTDRLILSHFGTARQLGDYAVCAVIYAPSWAVLTTVGLNLWGYFRSMDPVDAHTALRSRTIEFVGLGAVAAICFGFLAPIVANLVLDASVSSQSLWWWFAVLLLAQTIQLPFGMYLTDHKGLRFQAGWVALMVPASIALGALLIPAMGAAAPIAGSLVAVVVFQLVPNAVYVRRRKVVR